MDCCKTGVSNKFSSGKDPVSETSLKNGADSYIE